MDYNKIKKIFFKFQPETAHNIAEFILKNGIKIPFVADILVDKFCFIDPRLSQNLLGINFINPVGLAGGFDKNATMIKPLSALGFGFLEFGTITKEPQNGNQKPRLFRLIEEQSLQNAMGFNNQGAKKVKQRVLNLYPYSLPLIANIGKNKTTPNELALEDYKYLTAEFSEICDAFVINLSSPNTPNLRDLQENSFINELIPALKSLSKKPIFLKIAPDMDIKKALDICKNAIKAKVDAIVINNTSIDYSLSPNAKNFGGLSGQIIKEKSRKFFFALANEIYGQTLLISCGGINNANEAYERIKMGANLIQIYTGFIFEGPKICKTINQELVELLNQDGFSHISQAVGVNIRK